MSDIPFTFNLQDHLRDMESRLASAIKVSSENATENFNALTKGQTDLDIKLEGYNLRLTTVENDVKNAKKLAYTGLAGMSGLALDFIRKHVLG